MVGFIKSEPREGKNPVSCLSMIMGNLLLKFSAIFSHETLNIL